LRRVVFGDDTLKVYSQINSTLWNEIYRLVVDEVYLALHILLAKIHQK